MGGANCIAFYDNGKSLLKVVLSVFGRRAGE